jgi:uncharacterized protein DUF5658
MSRIVCISLVVVCLAAGQAAAQVSPPDVAAASPSGPLNPEVPRPAVAQLAAAAPVAAPVIIDGQLFRAPEPGRPAALVPMYASFVTLQALDFVSTTRALSNANAYEANPVMRGVVGSPAAFLAVKAGSTAATIWIAEKWRKKHPVRAMIFMASTNAAMAAVVAHNMSIK